MYYYFKLLLVFILLPSSKCTLQNSCGYESCSSITDGLINVHVIPHTHNDLGWTRTVDEYFNGHAFESVPSGVKQIIDSVIEALHLHPRRRFVYCETAFLWLWWQQTSEDRRQLIRSLVKNGQLEIVGGGWSMNDEAVTHYQSIIDEYTLGLRKLDEMFGDCGKPKVGWQIDPFGHSREMALLFAKMGYDGLLLGRVDHRDKMFRFDSNTLEFVWKGSDSISDSNLFTSILPNVYNPPADICFDVLCDYALLMIKNENEFINTVVKEISEQILNQAKGYSTNNLIITMGGDFQYLHAALNYNNMDMLIKYINMLQKNGSNLNLFYSTPSCYLKAVLDEAANEDHKWVVKTDDFFPYASKPHVYWTGFFTSRPSIKKLERIGNNYLQVCKHLFVLADLSLENLPHLEKMISEMGIMQHHDAITGTEREYVAANYISRLIEGFKACGRVTNISLKKLVAGNRNNSGMEDIEFHYCLLANVSECSITERSKHFVITVYNPLSRPVRYYVRVPVKGMAYTVIDPDGNLLLADLIPIPMAIVTIPGRRSRTLLELVFSADDVPPLGYKSFYIRRISGNKTEKPRTLQPGAFYEYNNIRISLHKTTGKVIKIAMNDKEINLSQDFFYYRGVSHDASSSGAYIFRPDGIKPEVISNRTAYKLYQGNVVSELHQTFNGWISQIIRIYKSEKYVEFDWVVGPIPSEFYTEGLEVITRYTTSLSTNSTFYTDSNGRQSMKRLRNFRRTWENENDEPVSGNYYPVTTKISLRDKRNNLELAVITDRAQGGSSLNEGEIELMLHRICLSDDNLGVGEALHEIAHGKNLVVRGSHFLVFGTYRDKLGNSVVDQEYDIVQRKLLSAWVFVSEIHMAHEEYKSNYRMMFSALTRSLPRNVQILTLEPWKDSTLLLRLEHIFESGENSKFSESVTVNLKNLFSVFEILSITETTLGANTWIANKRRSVLKTGNTMEDLIKWKSSDMRYWFLEFDEHNSSCTHDGESSKDMFDIILCPMEIRTFIVTYE